MKKVSLSIFVGIIVMLGIVCMINRDSENNYENASKSISNTETFIEQNDASTYIEGNDNINVNNKAHDEMGESGNVDMNSIEENDSTTYLPNN